MRFVVALLISVRVLSSLRAEGASGRWKVDTSKRRVVAKPAARWDAGDAAVIVVCVDGAPSFMIRERDRLSFRPEVTLQFGGHQDHDRIASVGYDGVARKYSTFHRGPDGRTAIASAEESADIFSHLVGGSPRLAWIVETVDGYDSLEIYAEKFNDAWREINCHSQSRRK